MGVVHLFGSPSCDPQGEGASSLEAANSNQKSAEVIQLTINKKIAHGVPPKTVYKQMEALLQTHGIDFGCEKVRSDYKIVTYLVQGMIDRADGNTSDRSMLLDVIRYTFGYEEPISTHDETNELFGDLLGRLD